MAQISLAVALVIGAALMAKGMESMLHSGRYGIQPDKVLTIRRFASGWRATTHHRSGAWYAASLDKLRALPGVTHAEITIGAALQRKRLVAGPMRWRTVPLCRESSECGTHRDQRRVLCSDAYSDCGRARDSIERFARFGSGGGREPRFVQQYFAGQNPTGPSHSAGRHDNHDPWVTIMGVAEETSYSLWVETQARRSLHERGTVASGRREYVVTTEGNPLALAAPARRALAAIDPALPLDGVMTWAQRMVEDLTGLMYASGMLGWMG